MKSAKCFVMPCVGTMVAEGIYGTYRCIWQLNRRENMSVGNRIQELRINNGLTQESKTAIRIHICYSK